MLNKAILLRLHRWVTLVFALPLAVVIGTGIVLAFEPVAGTASIRPGSLGAPAVEALLDRYDPQGQARGIAIRPYDNTLSINGPARQSAIVDLSSGEAVADGFHWSDLFIASRRLHENLMIGAGWIVVASTYAMLVLALLGVLMGWPRIRNTVAGWHKATAWVLLPLIVLSPLTGLFLAHGVTFTSPGAGPREASMPLKEAVRTVAKDHDLSGLNWIRSLGGRQMARIEEGGAVSTYAVTRGGLVPAGQNWPRLIHEGNFAAYWPGLFNALTGFAMALLLVTGLTVWARRTFRKRPAGRGSRRAASAAATRLRESES
jgi:uncharacterized iron-regulated membrane protein